MGWGGAGAVLARMGSGGAGALLEQAAWNVRSMSIERPNVHGHWEPQQIYILEEGQNASALLVRMDKSPPGEDGQDGAARWGEGPIGAI